MNFFFLLLIASALFAQSADPNCVEDQSQGLASAFAVPNCLRAEFVGERTKELCKDCGIEFRKKYSGPQGLPNKKDLQAQFLKLSVEEYKKNLSNNLIDAVKLAVLPNSNINLDQAIKACALKTESDLLRDCRPGAQELIKSSGLFNQMQKEVSNELAKFLSKDNSFNPRPTLLDRPTKKTCDITEKEMILVSNITLDEMFTPELTEAIGKLDPKNFGNMTELITSDEFSENYSGDLNQFKEAVMLHPYLRKIFENPNSAITFFRGVKKPFDSNSFRQKLYSEEYSKSFDSELAKSCAGSFSALKAAICSEEFENGNVNLEPSINSKKFFGKSIEALDDKYATSDDLVKKNLDILKYCPAEVNKNTLSLFGLTKVLSPNLEENYREQTLKSYSGAKYNLEIGNNTNLVCQMKDNCDQKLFACKMHLNRKKINTGDTVEAKLAGSSNEEVVKLLRSMVGTETKAFDPKTKEVLIANGIIPKEDGSFVKQPEVPERQSDFFAKAAQRPVASPQPQFAQTPAPLQQQQRNSAAGPSQEGYSNQTEATPHSTSELSDLNRDTNELRDIQNEIRRRISEMPRKSTPTKEDVRKAVRDTMASRNKSFSAAQETSLTNQMMAAPATTSASLSNLNREIAAAKTDALPGRAKASDSDSEVEKWRKSRQDAALMGMAGAQAISKDEIIANAAAKQEKELTSVALNLAEDPRVTLADILNNKLTLNDPETQLIKVLLRAKNNFVLQVKAMNFKIQFDEQHNFNILLQSGDRSEAERIRPQLEMFLKKLRT